MFFRLLSGILLAALIISGAGSALAQTVYDAEQGKLPLSFGGGVTNFDPDFSQGPAPTYLPRAGFGQGRMWGAMGWADFGIGMGPAWVHPLSVEFEYRSTFAGGTSAQSNLVESNLGGGATYTWRNFRTFRPYVKYILSYGMINFTPTPYPGHPPYSGDSRFSDGLGGGLEYRLTQHLWLRADYEYQLWGHIFGVQEFSPQGFTLGAMYHMNRPSWKH